MYETTFGGLPESGNSATIKNRRLQALQMQRRVMLPSLSLLDLTIVYLGEPQCGCGQIGRCTNTIGNPFQVVIGRPR